MKINIYHHHRPDKKTQELLNQIHQSQFLIINKLNSMSENTDKALADLGAIKDQLTKIGTETATLLQKITDLENAAGNADTPQSVLDAIAAVKAQAQVVDDPVPDATT